MRSSITHRVFLAMLAAISLAIVCLFLLQQWTIRRGFLAYLDGLDRVTVEQVAQRLGDLYAKKGNLDFLRNASPHWLRLLMIPEAERVLDDWPEPTASLPEPSASELRPPLGIAPPHRRLIVLNAADERLVGPTGRGAVTFHPVLHRSETVGFVGMLPAAEALDAQQTRFLSQQKLALTLAAGGVVLVAGLFSLLLARRLVRPIQGLAVGTRRLASGQYAARVPVASADELGQLARDFNALAFTLEKNEELRRRWVADISHELRTPLAILRGEVEALLDGVRAPTSEALGSLHGEVLRFTRLVDDLYQLSLSDLGALTYHKEDVDLAEILKESLDCFRGELARQEIRLEVDLPHAEGPRVFGDAERLAQLFTNLLDNALKYTDPGGQLVVRLSVPAGGAVVELEDSAPGVPEQDLGKLFGRLYRVEASRNRESGGAGLGLAIAKSIVEAHAGTIEASASRLGGLRISVTLPAEETR